MVWFLLYIKDMKRDCGKGELIPIQWSVVWCKGRNDEENERHFSTLDTALELYHTLVEQLKSDPCSNIRLYIQDKAGYANCIMSFSHQADGKFRTTDRRSEL